MLNIKHIEKMEKQNNIEQDILKRVSLKENPYSLPAGYFAMVEDSVQKKIHKESNPSVQTRIITMLKPSLMLAMMFAVIFGFGYGAMYLTGTTSSDSIESESLIVHEESSPANIEEMDSEALLEAIGSVAVLEVYAQSYIEEGLSETDSSSEATETLDNLKVNKDHIEQYLIESNISLTALASLE